MAETMGRGSVRSTRNDRARGVALTRADPMYGPAVRRKKFRRFGLRSCNARPDYPISGHSVRLRKLLVHVLRR
jgi:hypothetical protein